MVTGGGGGGSMTWLLDEDDMMVREFRARGAVVVVKIGGCCWTGCSRSREMPGLVAAAVNWYDEEEEEEMYRRQVEFKRRGVHRTTFI